jgi:hypothetical protein
MKPTTVGSSRPLLAADRLRPKHQQRPATEDDSPGSVDSLRLVLPDHGLGRIQDYCPGRLAARIGEDEVQRLPPGMDQQKQQRIAGIPVRACFGAQVKGLRPGTDCSASR